MDTKTIKFLKPFTRVSRELLSQLSLSVWHASRSKLQHLHEERTIGNARENIRE